MKKILLSLFGIITLGLNFGYCDNVSSYIDDILLFSGTLNYADMTSNYPPLFNYGDNGPGTYCINFISVVGAQYGEPFPSGSSFSFGFANSGSNASNRYMLYGDQIGNWICLYGNKPSLNLPTKFQYNFTYKVFKFTDLLNHSVGSSCDYSDYVSLSIYNECVSDLSSCNSLLSGYSNSLDICSSNYNNCTTSLNSCLQSNCPDSENPLNSFSNVYINRNNSYFPITGTNNIYVNLPSYIGYNYDYSNEGQDLNIAVDISQNTGYIEGVFNVQNYKPSSEDFTKLVGMLAPYTKYLVFLLFVFIIWAWIKKFFKSKKL